MPVSFTYEQYTRIKEALTYALNDCIETLIDKAGVENSTKTIQLLLHLYMYPDVDALEDAILTGITDEEITSAITQICSRLTATVQDLSARQLVRQVVGEDYKSDHLVQLVKNLTYEMIHNTINQLKSNTHYTQSKDVYQQMLRERDDKEKPDKSARYEPNSEKNIPAIHRMIRNITPDEQPSVRASPETTLQRMALAPPEFNGTTLRSHRQQHTLPIQPARQTTPDPEEPPVLHRARRLLHPTATQTHFNPLALFQQPRPFTLSAPARRQHRFSHRVLFITDDENKNALRRIIARLFDCIYQPIVPSAQHRGDYTRPYLFTLNSGNICSAMHMVFETGHINELRLACHYADLCVLYHPIPQQAVHLISRTHGLRMNNKLALLSTSAPEPANYRIRQRFLPTPRTHNPQSAETFIESLITEAQRLQAVRSSTPPPSSGTSFRATTIHRPGRM